MINSGHTDVIFINEFELMSSFKMDTCLIRLCSIKQNHFFDNLVDANGTKIKKI